MGKKELHCRVSVGSRITSAHAPGRKEKTMYQIINSNGNPVNGLTFESHKAAKDFIFNYKIEGEILSTPDPNVFFYQYPNGEKRQLTIKEVESCLYQKKNTKTFTE